MSKVFVDENEIIREWLERSTNATPLNDTTMNLKRPSDSLEDLGPNAKQRRLEESGVNDSMSIDCQSTGSGTLCDSQLFEEPEVSNLSSKIVKKPSVWPRHTSSASRLSVFMKDSNSISLLDSESINNGGPCLLQHMQDNLLLTACDVTCQLTVPPSAGLQPPSSEEGKKSLSYKIKK